VSFRGEKPNYAGEKISETVKQIEENPKTEDVAPRLDKAALQTMIRKNQWSL
jgi:hypothetical protein